MDIENDNIYWDYCEEREIPLRIAFEAHTEIKNTLSYQMFVLSKNCKNLINEFKKLLSK